MLWNFDLMDLYNNDVLDTMYNITGNTPNPRKFSKIYVQKAYDNMTKPLHSHYILLVSWPFIITRFHCTCTRYMNIVLKCK